MEEHEIMAELAAVTDALSALPADDFAERFALQQQQDQLRDALHAAQAEAGRDASEAWADQASRKQPVGDKGFVAPVVPDESSGGI